MALDIDICTLVWVLTTKLQGFQGTTHGLDILFHDVSIYFGGLHIGMPHEFLDDMNVYPVFEQMDREGMRKVWVSTRFVIPARSAAIFTAFCKPDSSTWCLRNVSDLGSLLNFLAGKTCLYKKTRAFSTCRWVEAATLRLVAR